MYKPAFGNCGQSAHKIKLFQKHDAFPSLWTVPLLPPPQHRRPQRTDLSLSRSFSLTSSSHIQTSLFHKHTPQVYSFSLFFVVSLNPAKDHIILRFANSPTLPSLPIPPGSNPQTHGTSSDSSPPFSNNSCRH